MNDYFLSVLQCLDYCEQHQLAASLHGDVLTLTDPDGNSWSSSSIDSIAAWRQAIALHRDEVAQRALRVRGEA